MSSNALTRLEQLRFAFGRGPATRKVALLDRLRKASLETASEVARLHAWLLFTAAYPDDRRVLSRVERMLDEFGARADLARHRDELVNSGIAGTEIRFSFYWFTLTRLIERWPKQIHIDWPAFGRKARAMLDRRLAMLMPYCETLALEEAALGTREWIERLKGPQETDAEFLVHRFEAMHAAPMPRETIFEEMDVPFRFEPSVGTPSVTHNRRDASALVFQKRPPVRTRETFWTELRRPPIVARTVSRSQARRLVDMGLTLMVTRTRDLDSFVHGSLDDVRVLDYSEGFQLVCIGARPERRQMLDAAYGFLMLRNGVLIGYALSAALFGSAEVAYNVSPEFRGAEAAHLYARCLHAVRHLFGADTFMVDPYQMGHENPEGLKSGAWWFYYKLGFRPRDAAIARMADSEDAKVRAKRGYRSSLAKLNRLSSVNMYLYLDRPRDEIIGEFARENVGLQIVSYLAERFGSDRERGLATCAREVAELTNLHAEDLRDGEKLALDRWAPMVCRLPIADWPLRDRVALGRVIRAKGGRRESEFVRLFDRHRRLRQAIFQLSRE